MAKKMSVRQPGNSFSMWFHWGLRAIEDAYKASRKTPELELVESREREAEFRKAVTEGSASWVERDEDGYPVYDYGEQLGEEQYQHEQTLSLIRHAFLIALHHYWEQKLAEILPRDSNEGFHYNQKSAFEKLEEWGWKPMKGPLNELRLIANCAKHGEGSSATKLFALRADLFNQQDIEEFDLAPSYETLLISDDHAAYYFEVVRKSVPRKPLTL